MKHKTKQSTPSKLFLLFGLVYTLFVATSNAQTSGIALSWDIEVGCQSYYVDPEQKDIFLEDITDGVCIRVCDAAKVTYTLTGLPAGSSPATVWAVAGGVITDQDDDSCMITWGAAGAGSLTMTLNLPDGVVTKTLCFEKIIKPKAFFTRAPNTVDVKYIVSCIYQTINFSNFSTTNNGTNLISYFWDFGDGTYSTAFSPSHMYTEGGNYFMSLTVTNACNCSTTYKKIVKIYEKGFDISCPTVVCDNQEETYTLPEAVQQECRDHFDWSSADGVISAVNPVTGSATVVWNNVGPSGFGYLTFIPAECNLECLIPTTIRVPVIQTVGTIVGDTNVCVKQQNIYKLPQWPTTDFHWEVIDNVDNVLAELILSDQRNEVVVKPRLAGQIRLRCTYNNTLLGCGGTAELVINVTSGQEFLGDFVLCNGTTGNYATTNGSPANWILKNQAGSTISTVNNAATYSYPFTIAGGYTLSVGGAGSCPDLLKNITVVPRPEAPLASSLTGALTVCPNAPYVYAMPNDPLTQYRWEVTHGTINGSATGNQVTVSFNGTTPAELRVYKESLIPILCPSMAVTIPITIQTIDATIAGNAAPCANSNGNYQANATVTSGLYTEGETYSWSISPDNLGSITAGQNTNTVNILWNHVTVPTSVTITLVITKCTITETVTKQIVIAPTPIIAITAVPTSRCSGAPFQFTVTATNGVPLAPGTVVTWNFGNGNTSGGLVRNFTFSNISAANIAQNVTAVIANANGCGAASNTASVQVTVFPGPSANLSISSGGNLFCEESSVNTILSVATTTGATIQWYQEPNALPLETGNTLDASLYGFGNYYFEATNSNGCTTESNRVYVGQFCPPEGECLLTPYPVLTNNSYANCGTLNLAGSTTIPPLFEHFNVVGPTSVSGYTAPTLNVVAGEYHVFYVAGYLCDGDTLLVSEHKTITVPYVPKFNYTTVCNGNATFTVTVVDNSDFFSQVDNRSFVYSYRLGTTGAWTTATVAADGTITPDLPPGNYQIRLVIGGDLNGVPQPPCEYIISMPLAPVPAQSISITTPPTCHDTAVGFDLLGAQPGDSFLWTFEPGAENTLKSPKRVFSSPGVKTVSVVITNRYGCSRTLTTTLTIPEPCFSGAISSPTTAVCLGTPVTLNYTSGADLCTVAQYTWMNGQEAVVGAPNAPTLQVTTPGFYWVNVKSNLNCSYDTPQRLTPTFLAPPSIKLTGPAAVCVDEEVAVNATTTATVIRWMVDGIPQGVYDNQSSVILTGLSVGTHTVIATAYSGIPGVPSTCFESAQQIVVVNPVPDAPVITQQIFCVGEDPGKPYYHVVLNATSNVTETFNWSNGMNGSNISVTDGGPYQVRVSSGGCSSTSQTDVPKNLEDYIWIFPTGCVTQCNRIAKDATLIGPRLPFSLWEWQYNGMAELFGVNTFPLAFPLTQSGTYNLALTQEACSLISPALDYAVNECEKCNILSLQVTNVVKLEQDYCAYQVTLTMQSATTYAATITEQNNSAVITPAAFTMQNGLHDYVFTVYPLGEYTGGTINFQIDGVLSEGIPCMEEHIMQLPSCESVETKIAAATAIQPAASVILTPNPAETQVTVSYNALPEAALLELYDLTGRSLARYTISNTQGTLTVPTDYFPSGIYIVVVRTDNGFIHQQKLILK